LQIRWIRDNINSPRLLRKLGTLILWRQQFKKRAS